MVSERLPTAPVGLAHTCMPDVEKLWSARGPAYRARLHARCIDSATAAPYAGSRVQCHRWRFLLTHEVSNPRCRTYSVVDNAGRLPRRRPPAAHPDAGAADAVSYAHGDTDSLADSHRNSHGDADTADAYANGHTDCYADAHRQRCPDVRHYVRRPPVAWREAVVRGAH